MLDPTNDRKLEHINIIRDDKEIDRKKYYFDAIRLRHRALPELALNDIDTSVEFMGKNLSFPLLISSMTGGDHNSLRQINKNLAIAAEATGVALGVGSQRVMFINQEARDSFALRQHAPSTLLFANLGAVQLNYGFTSKHCQEAIDVVGADGLCLHLNPLQEAIQPEGDTDFSNLTSKIGTVATDINKPVILKEVGAGISSQDVEHVIHHGVKYIDVAGCGGTSWSRIEYHRQNKDKVNRTGVLFQDWGLPTPLALLQLAPYRNKLTLLASGGIRSGIDMAKAIILGASLCGMASPFLKPAMESADKVIELIKQFNHELKITMFLLGIPTIKELFGKETLLINPHFQL